MDEGVAFWSFWGGTFFLLLMRVRSSFCVGYFFVSSVPLSER